MDAKRWYEKLHSHCVHNVYIKPQRKTGFSELTTKGRANQEPTFSTLIYVDIYIDHQETVAVI